MRVIESGFRRVYFEWKKREIQECQEVDNGVAESTGSTTGRRISKNRRASGSEGRVFEEEVLPEELQERREFRRMQLNGRRGKTPA